MFAFCFEPWDKSCRKRVAPLGPSTRRAAKNACTGARPQTAFAAAAEAAFHFAKLKTLFADAALMRRETCRLELKYRLKWCIQLSIGFLSARHNGCALKKLKVKIAPLSVGH